MKTLFLSLSAALLMITADAGAVTCAKGVVRAGCAGPNGAVVARKPATAVVVAPAPRAVVVAPPARQCAYVNGARVCR